MDRIVAFYKPAEHGFSLIEALVVLVVSATLMTTFSQVYLNSERANRHLQAYTEANRSAFYTRQQLRTWLSGITVPDDFGRSESDSMGRRSARAARPKQDLQPFIGSREQISGFLRDPLLSQDTRPFRLYASASSKSGLNGTLSLEFLEPEMQLELGLHKQPLKAFRFVDKLGVIHPVWPPQADDSARTMASMQTRTVSEALQQSGQDLWRDNLPGGIVLEFGQGEHNAFTLIVDVTP